MKAYSLILAAAFFLAAQAFIPTAHAHKVIASAYADGEEIEGEIGFSSGVMAKNAIVEILDDQGNKLGEVKTDDEGIFRYRPTKAIALTFRANLGQGHIALYRLTEDELPDGIGSNNGNDKAGAITPSDALFSKPANGSNQSSGSFPTDAKGKIIADDAMMQLIRASMKTELEIVRSDLRSAVRKEVKPLRKELAAYKEKNDLQTILGGIGYIIGLFGIGFYIAARRQAVKLRGSATPHQEEAKSND